MSRTLKHFAESGVAIFRACTQVLRVVHPVNDFFAVTRLSVNRGPHSLHRLHPRRMPDIELAARACTADFWTFSATFVDAYHVPETFGGPFESILDLGANVGYTAADFAWRYPDARILAVEMDPENFKFLETNVSQFGSRIDRINAAVWTHDQGVHYPKNVGAASYSARETSSPNQDQHVASLTIGQLLDRLPRCRAALVKMDVEGAEGILLAPEHSQWLTRVDSLTVEVHPPVSIDQLEGWLMAAGFSVTRSSKHWNALEAQRNPSSHTHSVPKSDESGHVGAL